MEIYKQALFYIKINLLAKSAQLAKNLLAKSAQSEKNLLAKSAQLVYNYSEGDKMFKRKAYDELLMWKEKYSGKYAALLEGARRVGKSTIAEAFAKNEYDSYILIDFANTNENVLNIFNDIDNLDLFYLRLQAQFMVTLIKRKSVIIFDEIQLYPKARQAIKYLVKDGRYDFIETGSLISIKKNISNILIPSEEYRISVYPMDFEEFCLATNIIDYKILKEMYKLNKPIGESLNRKLMRDFRIYLAIGGMPQAVEAYVEKKDFATIDYIKKNIIELYIADFKRIDPSGKLGMLYNSIPSQLALNKKRFIFSNVLGRTRNSTELNLIADLLDSKTVLICYDTTQPQLSLSQTKNLSNYKLYLSDVGLYTTMLFNNENNNYNDIYQKLLSDKLDVNLGYLYENVVAQIISSTGRDLYYHTWKKENSTHNYEIDFICISNNKLLPIEVKSGQIKNHNSIDSFCLKYSKLIYKPYVLSHYDVKQEQMLLFKPLYFLPLILE